ncbi:amidohydrolase family protein [Intestinibacter bartlettii]|uniref:amidohydrolase family protein n=1 Tax=Intestinibacter bartlettii TaxID=261299 RepID=UPI0035202A28
MAKEHFLPEQALSVEEAIKSYTIMGAYGSFEEKTKGSIEIGKVCDFVVLGQNPFEVEKDKLKDIEILATYLDGKCVFKK